MEKTDLGILSREDPFKLIGTQWMLVTASLDEPSAQTGGRTFNTMTASWGALGWLWNRPVAFIFIRPERFTHIFIERSPRITLSFFPESCRKALQICGSRSGKDTDKVREAGLTPIRLESGQIAFQEARLTLDCRKLFRSSMKEAEFMDKEILSCWYGARQGGLHDVYVLEIENVYQNPKGA